MIWPKYNWLSSRQDMHLY